jgi:hypothetical protein
MRSTRHRKADCQTVHANRIGDSYRDIGARVLLVIEPFENRQRLFPTEDMRGKDSA